MTRNTDKYWQTLDRFVEIRSRWITLIGEHLKDEREQVLEYWRVDRPDSAVVLPIMGERLLLPNPTYRPGVGELTLDFPGGRVPNGCNPQEMIAKILQRELGIAEIEIEQITPLNVQGWAVDSSFSNQKLYGFVAHIDPKVKLAKDFGTAYPITREGINTLLQDLTCLQCRAVLMSWLLDLDLE